MKKSTPCLLFAGILPIMLALGTSGCATKGFVRAQTANTNTKISALEAKKLELADKHDADISRVEEHIATTDSKVTEVAGTADQAKASAAQANQLAQQNQSAIASNKAALTEMDKTLQNAMTYTLVARGNVTFGFDKSNLEKTDEAALDALIRQAQSKPRAAFELLGFTDPVGTKSYNLALSRRRVDSVARYLVRQGVSLRSIHTIGLGKEEPPAALVAGFHEVHPNATRAEAHRQARRVLIRLYTADAGLASAANTASRLDK